MHLSEKDLFNQCEMFLDPQQTVFVRGMCVGREEGRGNGCVYCFHGVHPSVGILFSQCPSTCQSATFWFLSRGI